MGISIEKARIMNYFSNTNLLLKNNNSYDSNVLNLQSDLTTLGYSTNGIDGYFGDNTKAAVTAFQNDYGLDVDGIAGSQTLGKINELINGAKATTVVAPKPTPVYDSVSISGLIQMGSKGSVVTDLQEKLIRMGYNCGGYGADGDFGTGTYNSVVQFQKNNGLTQDGIVGPQTSQAIANALKTGNDGVPNYIMNKINTSSAVTSTANKVTSYSNVNLSKSMVNVYNSEVEKLQKDLTSFGYSTNGVDGYFGENTEAAVKKFQQDNHLSADGIAGQNTKNALYNIMTYGNNNPTTGSAVTQNTKSASGSAWSAAISGGNASATSSSTPSAGTSYTQSNLSKSMVGVYNSEVKKLQEDLVSIGYGVSGIDGYFGTNTEGAVIKFQHAKGLKEDGIAGPITKDAIAKEVASMSGRKLGNNGVPVDLIKTEPTTPSTGQKNKTISDFTISIGYGGTLGAGIDFNGASSLAIDSSGNVAGLITIGGGATSPAIGAGWQIQITNAKSIESLSSWGLETGVSAICAGVEYIAGKNPDGSSWSGISISVGANNVIAPFEVHANEEYTWEYEVSADEINKIKNDLYLKINFLNNKLPSNVKKSINDSLGGNVLSV